MAPKPMKDKFKEILNKFAGNWFNAIGHKQENELENDTATECSGLCGQFAVEFGEWVGEHYGYLGACEWEDRIGSPKFTYNTKQLMIIFKNRDK